MWNRVSPLLSAGWGYREKTAVYKSGSELSPDTRSASFFFKVYFIDYDIIVVLIFPFAHLCPVPSSPLQQSPLLVHVHGSCIWILWLVHFLYHSCRLEFKNKSECFGTVHGTCNPVPTLHFFKDRLCAWCWDQGERPGRLMKSSQVSGAGTGQGDLGSQHTRHSCLPFTGEKYRKTENTLKVIHCDLI